MCYLLGGLFHQNKFPVRFIGRLNLFFYWLLVFYYLTDTFALVLFHVIYITFTLSLLLFLNASTFASPLPYFHYVVTVLLLSPFEETLSSLYHYYYIINIMIA